MRTLLTEITILVLCSTLSATQSIYRSMRSMFVSCRLQAPSADEKVNLHFIAFVHVSGQLYELGELTTAEVRLHVKK